MITKCLICDKEFKTYLSIVNSNGGKYCSKDCYYKSKIGKHSGRKGMKFSDEWCKNLSLSHIGQIAWNKGLKGWNIGHFVSEKTGMVGKVWRAENSRKYSIIYNF